MAIDPNTPEEKRREKIEEMFEDALGKDSDNIYFEPPENVKLKYPCIIYERIGGDSNYANNNVYIFNFVYKATLIHKDPDSDIPAKLAKNTYVALTGAFVSDNLYHKVYTIY